MEISKIIPEIYYDLLGRVIPGLMALWIWCDALGYDWVTITVGIYVGSKTLSESVFVLVVTTLLMAYLVGYLIGPLSNFVHSKVLAKMFPSFFNVLKDASSNGPNQYPTEFREFFRNETSRILRTATETASASEYRRITYLWYDWVRITDPTAGTRLAKIRAEYRMLEGLCVVFGTAILGYVTSVWLISKAIDWGFIIGCTLVTIILVLNASRLFQTFQWAVINHYYQLKNSSSSNFSDPEH